jgi:outer membrane protein OmpA-like peptidoglycan-associated protein
MTVRTTTVAAALCGLLMNGCSVLQRHQAGGPVLFSHAGTPRVTRESTPQDRRISPAVVHFANDSHEISPDSLARLSGFVEQFADVPWRPVVIEGHTDANETEAYNMKLAGRRVESVKAALAGLGFPAELLRGVPKGESEPTASNAGAAGRRLNRRVELLPH